MFRTTLTVRPLNTPTPNGRLPRQLPFQHMALLIQVDSAESIAEAFAKNDMIMKALCLWDSDNDGAIGVGDDDYLAPYGIFTRVKRKSKKTPNPEPMYQMVFTAYKVRSDHHHALKVLKKHGRGLVLMGSASDLAPPDKWTKFREFAWAGGDDVCTKLEDFAFQKACEHIGCIHEAPLESWRGMRSEALQMMYDDEPSCRNLANKPLATLPTWGEVDFKTLTPEQVAEKEVQQRETALRIKKQKTEDEAEFWEGKTKEP